MLNSHLIGQRTMSDRSYENTSWEGDESFV